jgi:hypothetical protein
LKKRGKNPQQIFLEVCPMKPIEPALMESESPRVYRLVLTGGQCLLKVCEIPSRLLSETENGKSRGF